jgi:hypothetical protein
MSHPCLRQGTGSACRGLAGPCIAAGPVMLWLLRAHLPRCRLKHHMRTLLRSAHERDPFVDVIVVSVGLWDPRQ